MIPEFRRENSFANPPSAFSAHMIELGSVSNEDLTSFTVDLMACVQQGSAVLEFFVNRSTSHAGK
jgi:hypothetical protein